MELKINGRREEVQSGLTLADLLSNKGIKLEAVVVEHNGRICPRESYAQVVLQDNDCLEVITLVGGG